MSEADEDNRGTAGADGADSTDRAGRREADPIETARANRAWWDVEAGDYYAEHGVFLGDDDFVWGPEGLREADAGLLGDLDGKALLEIGAGAAQCSRYAVRRGARVVATDISGGMLRQGLNLNLRFTLESGLSLPLVQCDAASLPFGDGSFDTVFTSYGAVPFVADSAAVMTQAARVLRPGGRFVFSTTHPIRWALPDDPGYPGLTVTSSYFDRTPYVELEAGAEILVEDRVTNVTLLASSAEFVNNQPELTRRLIAAHRELTQWIKDHPSESAALIKAELTELMHAEPKDELIARALSRIVITDAVSRESLDTMVRAAQRAGFLKEIPALDQLLPQL